MIWGRGLTIPYNELKFLRDKNLKKRECKFLKESEEKRMKIFGNECAVQFSANFYS
jgi:hypothetical protein